MEPVKGLEVRKLGVFVAGRLLVRDVSFTARAGEITCLVGPNGAGKSTLIKSLASILPRSGTAVLDGQNLAALAPRERAAAIGYVPQRTNIALPFRVADIVSHGLYAEAGDGWTPPQQHLQRSIAALENLGMSDFKDRVFQTLSGGEQQLVLLARALVSEPRLVVLDEPASALDIRHRLELDRRLRALAAEGLTVLVVLHDLAQVLEIADAVIVLSQGQVVSSGSPWEALSPEVCGQVFGVQLNVRGGPAFSLKNSPQS